MKQKWVNILSILVLVFILIPLVLQMFNIKITENMENVDISGNNLMVFSKNKRKNKRNQDSSGNMLNNFFENN